MKYTSNEVASKQDDELMQLLQAAQKDIEDPHKIFKRNNIHRIVLLLGTSRECVAYEKYKEDASALAKAITEWSGKQSEEDKIWVCSGGKGGLMSKFSEGVSSAGGNALGFGFSNSGHAVNHNQKSEYTHLFSELGLRDFWLYRNTQAIVAFPGGLGTLAELFDALLHIQLGLKEGFPIFLFGSDFWKSIVDFEKLQSSGVLASNDIKKITYTDDIEEIYNLVVRGESDG